MTTKAEVTAIIACGAMAVGVNAVVEMMRGVGGSVTLVDIREAMSTG